MRTQTLRVTLTEKGKAVLNQIIEQHIAIPYEIRDTRLETVKDLVLKATDTEIFEAFSSLKALEPNMLVVRFINFAESDALALMYAWLRVNRISLDGFGSQLQKYESNGIEHYDITIRGTDSQTYPLRISATGDVAVRP
jgi:hypothetical protein